jgi:Ca2+-binding EF-hand superfamily protein
VVSSSAFGAGADPGSGADVQDLLFFHESRPVLIRLHILVDGKPYPARWNEYLTRWFRFLDRNDDGFLDRKEAACAPAARLLEDLFSNPYTYANRDAPDFDEFDRDHDKRVSLTEFLHYYRQSSAGPIQLVSPFNQPIPAISQDALTEALFTLLDKDKDNKLSRAELEDAETVLHKFDQDDDELLTLQEIQAAVPPSVLSMGSTGRGMVPAMQAPVIPLLLVPREDAVRRIDARLPVARNVMKHYDKNNNKALSRDEIDMPKELFERLDANKDGELDIFELLRWMIVTPDAEAVVRLGRVEVTQELIAPAGAENPALVKKARNTLSYAAPARCVNLIAAASMPAPATQAARAVIVRQFQTIDQKERGFLSKKQLQGPQFYYLHSILAAADRDGDECLDLKELHAFLDLTSSGLNCQVSVGLAASGRGLFAILDANQDSRLSLREQRTAWKRLAVYDSDKDGAIARTEIPLQYQVVFTPGPPNYQAGQLSGFQPPPGTMRASAPDQRVPLWFRKMDRNGDGDVSQREFLGSRDDFRRLDTDRDGLISVEEAMRADAALRKRRH